MLLFGTQSIVFCTLLGKFFLTLFFFFFKEKGLYLNDFAIVGAKRPIIGIEQLLVVQYNLLKNSFSIDLTDFLTEILMDAGSIKLPM